MKISILLYVPPGFPSTAATLWAFSEGSKLRYFPVGTGRKVTWKRIAQVVDWWGSLRPSTPHVNPPVCSLCDPGLEMLITLRPWGPAWLAARLAVSRQL
jgi:hypothetical protein